MALAVTHVLIPIVVLSLFRFYYKRLKKNITIHEVFAAGVAGLLPDIDVPIDLIFGLELHRVFTHTFVVPIIIILIGFFLLRNPKGKTKGVHWQTLAFVAAFGWAFHIFLDMAVSNGVPALWPLSSMTFGWNLLDSLEMSMTYLASLDAVILLGWLWHEDAKHKIIDYI